MSVLVAVAIVEGAILAERERMLRSSDPSLRALDRATDGVGARLRFEGIVRGLEEGRPIAALDYEVYEPMASRELARVAREEAERAGARSILVLHSSGRVAVGEVSFLCEVASPHRAEALAALAAFVDRMKREVPIWKRVIPADGA